MNTSRRQCHHPDPACRAMRVLRESGPEAGGQVFARANQWMVDLARRIEARPHALTVWDGMPGAGPGGTADLFRRLGYSAHDPYLRLISPDRCI